MGNASLPSQHAALAALARQDVPPAEVTDMLRRHWKLVDEALSATPLLKYRQPGGAFYAFIDIRAITADSAAWCEQLLEETGVALVPGEAFSAPGFVRIRTRPMKPRSSALARIKKFVAQKGGA